QRSYVVFSACLPLFIPIWNPASGGTGGEYPERSYFAGFVSNLEGQDTYHRYPQGITNNRSQYDPRSNPNKT
ncbi:hypothetical protein PUR37_28180, partial [Klebsiella pneumoniae]|uniref:hypothetical protein n=1 Tax=Klebsiella pneumoniae TaxID=573 RepID=UPI0023F7D697